MAEFKKGDLVHPVYAPPGEALAIVDLIAEDGMVRCKLAGSCCSYYWATPDQLEEVPL
jgi:hypothetical protein